MINHINKDYFLDTALHAQASMFGAMEQQT